jgi:uncharacterized protein YeaO (DUF488 family)
MPQHSSLVLAERSFYRFFFRKLPHVRLGRTPSPGRQGHVRRHCERLGNPMQLRKSSHAHRPRIARRRPNRSPVCFAEEPDARAGDPDVRIKRIYESPEGSDGFRVLVDRIWPRGVRKDEASLDAWARDLAPSGALRTWFHHDRERWVEFQKRYRSELRSHEADLLALRARSTQGTVTLLYAARDPQINHAAVLRDAIIDAR